MHIINLKSNHLLKPRERETTRCIQDTWPYIQITQQLTLPEGEENNTLDSEELYDGVEGFQQLLGRVVEEEEPVQGEGDGDVVDDRDVEVASLDAWGGVFIYCSHLFIFNLLQYMN